MSNRLTLRSALMMTLLSLFGCAKTHTFHTGTFNGVPYELQSTEKKGFTTNSISYAVKLGRWKTAKIDALTTDWGPPYADDLYGDALRVYIDPNHTPYSNERDNPHLHPSTMLYLSPKRFSREAFDQYVALLKSEWTTIDRLFKRDEYDRFPHIIGLVYGEQQGFTRIFRGKKDGQNYYIAVEPDGRIRFEQDQKFGAVEYCGLSEKVQMPGKILYVATGKDAGLPLSAFQAYRDERGKTLSDYFTLTEKR